jgi:hypothetical protein
MEEGPVTAQWLITADAADLFEGQRPEERTLVDACRPPFSFGLLLLIPAAIMVAALIMVLEGRPAFEQTWKSLQVAAFSIAN